MNYRATRLSAMIFVAFISATALVVSQDQIKVIYDPRPDPDFEAEFCTLREHAAAKKLNIVGMSINGKDI